MDQSIKFRFDQTLVMLTDPYRRIILILFSMSLALSISGALIFGAILLLDWGVGCFFPTKRLPWKKTLLDFLLLGFWMWWILTSFVTKSAGVFETLGRLNSFLLFYLLAHGTKQEDLKTMVTWFCVASVIGGMMGVIQYLSQVNYLPNENIYNLPEYFHRRPQWLIRYCALRNERAVGSRNHPLTYAEGMVPAFFLVLVWLFHQRAFLRKGSFWLGLFGLGFVAIGLLLSQSRGVWVGLMAGLLLIIILSRKEIYLRRAVLTLLITLSLVITVTPKLRGRLMSVFSGSLGSSGDQKSKEVRYLIWNQAWGQTQKTPWFGVGYNGTNLMVRDEVLGQDRYWTETHNMFLQFLLEGGWVGLGLFLIILFFISKSFYGCPDPWRIGLQATLIAFFVAGFTESWTRDKEVAMIFWSMVGAAEKLRLGWDPKQKEEEEVDASL